MNRLDTRKKLARKRGCGGLASNETVSNPLPRSLCVYSNRELPGMQEYTQGGTPFHATSTLSL